MRLKNLRLGGLPGSPELETRMKQGTKIEVDFRSVHEEEREDKSTEVLARLDTQIASINAEIQKMVPILKDMKMLGDADVKLAETEKEADRAGKVARGTRLDDMNDDGEGRCFGFTVDVEAQVHGPAAYACKAPRKIYQYLLVQYQFCAVVVSRALIGAPSSRVVTPPLSTDGPSISGISQQASISVTSTPLFANSSNVQS
ncbi:hypothetical protein AX14_000488 [Amanita brunnescens Koide BX004]|nr:hypothetical protein AX14_000488 [Amanita brunnescens Koide BX004]